MIVNLEKRKKVLLKLMAEVVIDHFFGMITKWLSDDEKKVI